MNNLREIYSKIKYFADEHKMVNQFIMVSSEGELENREFDYRSLIIVPSSSNISRDLNSPVYTLTFTAVILDQISSHDPEMSITSMEENIFILGQLQDYMLQQNIDVDFEDVDLTATALEDYNVTGVYCDFDVRLGRSPYTKGINH